MIEKKQDLTPMVSYALNGVTYVPHFKNPDAFVRPGYPKYHTDTYSAAELEAAGAKPTTEFLWPRPMFAAADWNKTKEAV